MGMFRPTRPPFPPPEPEIIYVPGPQGPQGPQGDKGDKGDTGPMGPKGEQGIQGIKGDTGERGPIGPSGERGDVGEKGAKGQKGDKGDKGETGPQGIQGPKGDKGDTGDRGPRGYVGPQGQDGADGADGAKGEKGDKGDRGERGYTGQQGPKGDTGERGPIGIQGQRGPKGDTGDTGPQGPKGDKGEKGDKGDPGSGSDTNAVHYTTDTGKTSSEKEQARANIGAQEAISATGFLSRDALGNISGVESQAITSYETLPVSMGGTGSNTADGARQSIGAVKEPLSEGTNGQFLSTDGNGGRIWKTVDLAAYRTSAAQDAIDATKQTKITASGILQGDGSGGVTAKPVDATPTASSENLVTSGGVATALANKANLSTLSTPYSPTSTYAVGDYCTHDGSLQRCSVPITEPEEWTAAHWTEKKVVDGFSDIKRLKINQTFLSPDSDGTQVIPLAHDGTYGVIHDNVNWGFVISGGAPYAYNLSLAQYNNMDVRAFIGKGSLETVANARGWTTAIKTTIDAVLMVNTGYYLGEQTTLTLTLPTTGMSAGQTISVVFYSNTTATTLNIVGDFLGYTPTISANQRVELSFLYDGTYWCLLSNVMSVPQDEVSE